MTLASHSKKVHFAVRGAPVSATILVEGHPISKQLNKPRTAGLKGTAAWGIFVRRQGLPRGVLSNRRARVSNPSQSGHVQNLLEG